MKIGQDKEIKTRKNHMCSWCPEKIKSGKKARYRFYEWEGEMVSEWLHHECYQAMLRCEWSDDGYLCNEQARGKTMEETELLQEGEK